MKNDDDGGSYLLCTDMSALDWWSENIKKREKMTAKWSSIFDDEISCARVNSRRRLSSIEIDREIRYTITACVYECVCVCLVSILIIYFFGNKQQTHIAQTHAHWFVQCAEITGSISSNKLECFMSIQTFCECCESGTLHVVITGTRRR